MLAREAESKLHASRQGNVSSSVEGDVVSGLIPMMGTDSSCEPQPLAANLHRVGEGRSLLPRQDAIHLLHLLVQFWVKAAVFCLDRTPFIYFIYLSNFVFALGPLGRGEGGRGKGCASQGGSAIPRRHSRVRAASCRMDPYSR
uniref:Uncharacterized protein n=1 Tax=Physcomitrium patens TaxID=3218 RepID=A9TA35_PHYPA|nr:hypothetical protein PHYPA_025003 [Physcomitrium patens]